MTDDTPRFGVEQDAGQEDGERQHGSLLGWELHPVGELLLGNAGQDLRDREEESQSVELLDHPRRRRRPELTLADVLAREELERKRPETG